MIFTFTDIRFADLQLLRYQVPGFTSLSLRQKLYCYYLSEAALWGRDILFDQNGRYNLRIRRLLESILQHSTLSHDDEQWSQMHTYLRRVWFSSGIHHYYATDKFLPGFTQDFLRRAVEAVPPVLIEDSWEELLPIIFRPEIMPKRVCQTGSDLLLSSASNYYAPDVTQHEAEDFYGKMKKNAPDPDRPIMYGMNSRLEKKADGSLWENTYRSGGLYGEYIAKIVSSLEKAREYAETTHQQEIIDTLVEFYNTGDLKTFDRYTIQWIAETKGEIDFINGFTEVYGDPLGLKASWEGYVNCIDREATHRTELLSQNAQWFEDNSPVDSRFKKTECRGVSARVVNALILGGDLYPSSAIGINLPNSNWIRSEYGSKSVTIGNLTHAYDEAARGNGFRDEFVIDRETIDIIDKYGDALDDLHTDLHECLGHGSGRLLPGVDPDALGVYGSTIEEARADLFGLYYIADHKLVEMGLTPDDEAWHSQYYTYMMNGLLTQLVRIEPGNDIEEAHMRNRALIAHWCVDHGSAVELVKNNGKTYLKINDYPTLRILIAQLLAEVQRIKSEGDYNAARDLVENYGVKVDRDIHQEILARYQALDLAPYKGFINPRYNLVTDVNGTVTDVSISYDETYDEQMLRYGREYSLD